MNDEERELEQRDEIVKGLDVLQEQMREQMSVWHTFRNGVIYGVGFVVGSTVVTTVLVTFVIQFFSGTALGDVMHWFAAKG